MFRSILIAVCLALSSATAFAVTPALAGAIPASTSSTTILSRW